MRRITFAQAVAEQDAVNSWWGVPPRELTWEEQADIAFAQII
jgi:hypothetical protein